MLAIHDELIAEHGGLPGIRDIALLDSALARPQSLEAYANPSPDIASLAAAYAFGIAKNHAFADGNKRTSSVVTRTFLIINDYDTTADEATRLDMWMQLSADQMTEEQFANWLRANITKT